MLLYELHIYDGADDKGKRFPKELKGAMIGAAKLWHSKMLLGHFKAGAATKYGYAKRTPKYLKRKQKMGAKPDLVYTGRSRLALNRSYAFRVSGAGKGTVKGRFTVGPHLRYFWMTPARHPKKAQEMKSMTKQEVARLTDVVKTLTAKAMNEKKSRRKRVVR